MSDDELIAEISAIVRDSPGGIGAVGITIAKLRRLLEMVRELRDNIASLKIAHGIACRNSETYQQQLSDLQRENGELRSLLIRASKDIIQLSTLIELKSKRTRAKGMQALG